MVARLGRLPQMLICAVECMLSSTRSRSLMPIEQKIHRCTLGNKYINCIYIRTLVSEWVIS